MATNASVEFLHSFDWQSVKRRVYLSRQPPAFAGRVGTRCGLLGPRSGQEPRWHSAGHALRKPFFRQRSGVEGSRWREGGV